MRFFRNLLQLVPLVLSLLVLAPAQETPTADPEHHVTEAEAKELFRSVDDLLKFASERTGLPIRHPVKKKLATRDEVAKYVELRMKEQGNGERFDRSAIALKKLGLLPRNFNLREYMLGLYREQVEGWYDAHSKTVYLLDWVSPEVQKPVMAHELVHALQDQSYDLEKWLNVRKDSKDETEQMVIDEQRTARQSIIEGQAMMVLFDYQLTPVGQTVESAPDLVDSMKASVADEESTPMYAKAPIYLREAMLFPYTFGMDFVRAVLTRRGQQAAFAGVLDHPPLDTRQIMEPATYLNHEPQVQFQVVPLEKVLGPNWRRDDFSGIGEVDLRVILRQWGGKDAAAKLSPAWRGGYYMTLANKKSPKDSPTSLALVLNFSSPTAANKFAAIYESALGERYKSVQPANAPHQWITEEGAARLYIEGSTAIALESFTAEDAAKIHETLKPAITKPFEITTTPTISPSLP
ncbi:MAG TPA: hypothetical protein VM578_04785 [Candidatus Saccharimonadales bacterium]|nr:hypothetical protein [Candidatus Saccharimonadales bacterium]